MSVQVIATPIFSYLCSIAQAANQQIDAFLECYRESLELSRIVGEEGGIVTAGRVQAARDRLGLESANR